MQSVKTLLAAWTLHFAWRRCLSEVTYGYEVSGESCVMGGGVWGFCEEVQACLADGGVVEREGRVHLCNPNLSGVIVCCRKPHRVAKELCDAWTGYWKDEAGNCVSEKNLIIGGKEAGVGEFPHTVMIGSSVRNLPIRYNCGGTLLSPYHVLTAAHCLFSSSKEITFWVKLGEHDRQYDATSVSIPIIRGHVPPSLYRAADLQGDPRMASNHSVPPSDLMTSVEQVIEVEDMKIYPYYRFRVYKYHDIGVLRLKNPVRFTKRVLPACLPFDLKEDYRGWRLTVVGWGLTSGLQEVSQTLQKVDIPVIDSLTCSTVIKKPDKLHLGITTDMLCAGEAGKDSCKGDSGGPLTALRTEEGVTCEHSVVGVVSFGEGQKHSLCGLLGVYMRVSSYLDWITGLIAPNATAVR